MYRDVIDQMDPEEQKKALESLKEVQDDMQKMGKVKGLAGTEVPPYWESEQKSANPPLTATFDDLDFEHTAKRSSPPVTAARKKGQALPKSNTRPKGIKGPRMALKETESNTDTLSHTPTMPFSLLERLSAANALSGALESANSVPDPLGGAAPRSAAARAAEPAPCPLGHRDQHGSWEWRCPDCPAAQCAGASLPSPAPGCEGGAPALPAVLPCSVP